MRRPAALAACLAAALAGSAAAQDSPPAAPPAPQPTDRDRGAWTAQTHLSAVFDSNIDRNDEEIESYGGVVGLLLQYQRRAGRYRVSGEYETAAHQYTTTDRWNRVSHRVRGLVRRELGDRWNVEAVSELSLRGSSEDRNLGDQLVVEPRVNFALDDDSALRLYGALRVRRFDEEPDQNALNRYLGLEFAQEVGRGREWEVGFRYEFNDAESDRRRYLRRTWHTAFATEIGRRDELEFELKIRARRYTDRYVEVEEEDVPRQDHRWIPSVEWSRTIWQGLGVAVKYEFETRASNDPDRSYSGHQAAVSLFHRW